MTLGLVLGKVGIDTHRIPKPANAFHFRIIMR